MAAFILDAVPEKNPVPGAVTAIRTFGDVLGINPYCHILVTDGCFYGKGMFWVAPHLELKKMEAIFKILQGSPALPATSLRSRPIFTTIKTFYEIATKGQASSSWAVISTISNSRTPPGVFTLTSLPTHMPISALPIGEVTEILFFSRSDS